MKLTKFVLPGVTAALLFAPALAGAMAIDKTVNISVYQVCDSTGACASTGPTGNDYYAAETNKIWAQAGIGVTFSFVQQITSDTFYNLYDNGTVGHEASTFDNLYNSIFPDLAGSNASSVAMFLVNDYQGAYGVGYSGYGGLVMSMKNISEYDCDGAAGCTGRIDTLAHELGHNFGLVPESFSDYAGEADPGHSNVITNLMAGGEVRTVPVTLADIAPDGGKLDYLPQNYIEYARNSSLLASVSPVPEPSSVLMLSAGLGILGFMRRRKSGQKA